MTSKRARALSTTREVDEEMVAAITDIDDDIYRNHWITFAYHRLSERMRPLVRSIAYENGARVVTENATWCTFARWSSFTVGEALDLDRPVRRLNDLLSFPLLRPLRTPMQRAVTELRRLSDSSMPRTLGIGNRYVFHDIASAMVLFLDWYDRTATTAVDEHAWMDAWKRFRPSIEGSRGGDLFQDADDDLLRDGLEQYLLAMRSNDADERRQHVLHGNVLLAVYEQWRLDPIIKIALDPLAANLIEFRVKNPHDGNDDEHLHAVLRNRGTQWATQQRSAIYRWVAEQYAQIITSFWLTYDAPLRTNDPKQVQGLVVGQGIPVDARAFPRPAEIDDEDLRRVLSIYDHDRRIVGSASWTRFADRMQFIVDLFCAEQDDPALHVDSHLSKRVLELDITDHNLDHLRETGDNEMDDFVRRHLHAVGPAGEDAAALVRRLIKDGLQTSLPTVSRPGGLDGVLPDWAVPAQLERGQKFLDRNKLQIASALFNASLPMSYTAARGAHVLTTTAELASGHVNRRIAETGLLLESLMVVDPRRPPLSPGTQASNAVRGVRLFHGAVRRMLLHGDWHRKRKGYPINQEDLIGTLVVFTVVALDAIEDMGVRVSERDREDYIHLWQVVGFLLGIDYELIHRPHHSGERSGAPPGYKELRTLGDAIFRRNSEASPDGQALASALTEMMSRSMWRPFRAAPATATRWLIGDGPADLLAIPPGAAPIRLALQVTKPITRLITGGRLGRAWSVFMDRNTDKMFHDWIDENQGRQAAWCNDHDDVDLNRGDTSRRSAVRSTSAVTSSTSGPDPE